MTISVIGNNTGDDYSGTEDTYGGADSPTTNNDGNELELNYWNAGPLDRKNVFISFSGLSNISASDTVSAASMHLYRYGGNATARTIDIHRLLRNWVEGQVTWDDYATGSAWTTGGALSSGNDHSATLSDTYETSSSTGLYINVANAANFVQDIQDFVDGTYSNYGWLMYMNETDGPYYSQYRDSESTDGQRPYLSVTHTAAAGGATIPIMAHHYRNQGIQ